MNALAEHAAGANITFFQRHEIVYAHRAFPLHEPQGLAQPSAIESIPQRARIREVGCAGGARCIPFSASRALSVSLYSASEAIFCAMRSNSSSL